MNGAGEKSFATDRKWPRVLVLGIGEGGLRIVEPMAREAPVGVELAVAASDGEALRRSAIPIRLRLGAGPERGLLAGLFEDADAVILVADLTETLARKVVVEIARIAVGLRLLTLTAVSTPRHGEASRARADDVTDELAAGVHAHFSTGPAWAQDSESKLRAAVLGGARLVVEGLRRGSAEGLARRWSAESSFVVGEGLTWHSGARITRGGPTRGGFGMSKDENESIVLGIPSGRGSKTEPPLALSVEEPPPGVPAAPSSSVPATPTVDQVSFTVTAPKTVAPGEGFLLDVWAHTSAQLNDVLAQAGGEISRKTSGPVRLARGIELIVEVKIADFAIDEPQAVIEWLGEIGNANFAVTVPAGRKPGSVLGKASIHAAGIRTLTVNFQLEIGKAENEVAALPAWEVRYRSAFASYSSKDRDEVLGRIQGMQKIVPDLDVFLDVASLHSGENWEERLWREINRCDKFFLFWSQHAKTSPWVEKEWRLAFETKGLDFIDPVPLVPPHEAPPPPELGAKHFNDKWLAFRRAPG